MRGAWLAVALLLAGCSGAASPETEDPLADLGVEVTEALGGIKGVVVDESIRPIANATVHIASLHRNATTDGRGAFAFGLVPPGTQFVSAAAPGFLPLQTAVEVQAGQVAVARLALPLDATPQPYHVTLPFKGFIELWAGIGQFFVEEASNGTSLCQCYLRFTPDPGLAGLVLEATWDPTTPDPTGAVGQEFYWGVEEEGAGGLFEGGYCTSPCRADVPLKGHRGGPAVAYLQGPDLYVAAEQPYELYLTLFYREPQPAGWSFLAGDR